jgi:two-component system response regulator FixJ
LFLQRKLDDHAIGRCIMAETTVPECSGLELFAALLDRGVQIPVILVGEAEVSQIVAAMRSGAESFLPRDFNVDELSESIRAAFSRGVRRNEQTAYRRQAEAQLNSLTRDEKSVMKMVVGGLQNKQIARRLDVGLRTVELRRARVMEKLQAASLAELIRKAIVADEDFPSPDE